MEITMVGGLKSDARSVDGKQHFSPFRDIPRLQKGGDYLLFASPESAIGLSTTVGLGQGAFKVAPLEGELHAVNEFNNAGLGLNGPGPVRYVDLSARINELLGN